MNLSSKRYEVDDLQSPQEFYHSRKWTDGLPVVPPTPNAVEACLEWVMIPANHLVGIEPVRQRAITAEKLAVNAVMAGCLPMHFPWSSRPSRRCCRNPSCFMARTRARAAARF